MSVLSDSRLRVSRRGFLKASGVTAAAASTAGFGVVPFTASKAAAQDGWDAEHDVVVVGSGGAAFAAAITAKHEGGDVVMFEKGAYVGGTTLVSGGAPPVLLRSVPSRMSLRCVETNRSGYRPSSATGSAPGSSWPMRWRGRAMSKVAPTA